MGEGAPEREFEPDSPGGGDSSRVLARLAEGGGGAAGPGLARLGRSSSVLVDFYFSNQREEKI